MFYVLEGQKYKKKKFFSGMSKFRRVFNKSKENHFPLLHTLQQINYTMFSKQISV
jgi:hypothetical protein